ncbi:MAG: Mpo1-like protein [Woeseiaceae bacterium]
MLVGYASAHQHPVNIAVHLIGIPTIMLGVFIPLTWVSFEIGSFTVNLAQATLLAMFVFYLTLDWIFALVFLALAVAIAELAAFLGDYPRSTAAIIAAAAFFGGYAAQFIGHAVEKSMPVLLKHPIQANLAAPFFTIVEVFKLVGLREKLFAEVQKRIAALREQQAGTADLHP